MPPAQIALPKPFHGPEHLPFFWKGKNHAALLIHGFPGTPAEMRPLGLNLKDLGWTVSGLTLPGFAGDIETLEQRRLSDWTGAVAASLRELQRDHDVIVAIGYSMGGALALHAALEQRLNGLVLLAPFWSLGERWLDFLWPLIRLTIRRFRPLKQADFSAPEVRRSLSRMFGDVALDDPDVQKLVRGLTISVKTLEQLRLLGKQVFRKASALDTPTMVIQGLRDHVVPPDRTTRLINRFTDQFHYYEVNAGHDVVDPEGDGWGEVKTYVLGFAESIRNHPPPR